MTRIIRLVILSVVLQLMGCASMPLSSMYKLSQFDPMTADPGQIMVAIRTSDALTIRKGDVRINLEFEANDGSLQLQDEYLVEVVTDASVYYELLDGKQDDEKLTILQLSPQDAAQLRQAQALIKPYQESGEKHMGNFGISLNSSCLDRPVTQEQLLVDVFFHADQEDGFFIFNEDLDLFKLENNQQFDLNDWPICSEES